jgi:YD repeat-containing protein
MVFGAEGARAASPGAACPGEVSVGPTADMIPAPAGMPLNCTIAFSDGTVDFADRATGYAYDADAGTTTIYDQQGQLVGVTNSLGETTILGPEKGVLSTVADPLGHTTTFTYDAQGSVAQVIAPMSSETSYTYDSSERVITVTDPLGS